MAGLFLLPGADYTPQIIFKTAAVILAVVQRLLCCNTCRRFLGSSKPRGLLLLAGVVLSIKRAGRVMILATGGKRSAT